MFNRNKKFKTKDTYTSNEGLVSCAQNLTLEDWKYIFKADKNDMVYVSPRTITYYVGIMGMYNGMYMNERTFLNFISEFDVENLKFNFGEHFPYSIVPYYERFYERLIQRNLHNGICLSI